VVQQPATSQLQTVLDAVENLPDDDQALLIEILNRRLAQRRRTRLVAEVAEAQADYQAGRVQEGDIDALLEDLNA
jgi:hypothetical protein